MVGQWIVMGECMAHISAYRISHNGAMRACHDVYLRVIRWITTQHSKIIPDPHVHHCRTSRRKGKEKPTIGSGKGGLTNQEFPTNLFPFFSAS